MKTSRIAIHCALRAPLFLFLLQAPLAITEILQEALGINNSVQPPLWAVFIVLPTFFVLSFLSSALTLAAVFHLHTTGRCSWNNLWAMIRPKIRPLLIASIALGSLAGLGLVAYIIPGLLLMTLFLFVPHVITLDPPTSLWAYVTRSKRLVSRHPFVSFFIVVFSFGLSALLFLLGEHFGTYYGVAGSTDFGRLSILIATRSLFSMFGALIIDVWVAAFFLYLRNLE